jgi:hypothetical protein
MAWVGSGFLDPLCFEGLCLVSTSGFGKERWYQSHLLLEEV